MTGEQNGFNTQSGHNDGPFKNPDINQEIKSLIGPAVAESVSQYHGLLRQGLEQEVKRIIDEFETATADIESIVADRVKARLHELVEQEVRRVFDDALSNAEDRPFADPLFNQDDIWKRNASATGDANGLTSNYDALGGLPNIPYRADVGTDGDDKDNRGGYGRSGSQPESISPPSAMIAQDFELKSDESEEEVVATAESPDAAHDSESDVPETALDYDDPLISDDEVFEGTVRLNVEASESIKHVVNFVRELRQKPQLRLLRLVGNNRDGVDIWLGLREPITLQRMLPKLKGVDIISTPIAQSQSSQERRLNVRLISIPMLPSKESIRAEPSNVSHSDQTIT